MGPDSNKTLKPGFKSISMLVLWSMEIIDSNRLKWKDVVKEEKDHGHS